MGAGESRRIPFLFIENPLHLLALDQRHRVFSGQYSGHQGRLIAQAGLADDGDDWLALFRRQAGEWQQDQEAEPRQKGFGHHA
jgi:hypothetical protein